MPGWYTAERDLHLQGQCVIYSGGALSEGAVCAVPVQMLWVEAPSACKAICSSFHPSISVCAFLSIGVVSVSTKTPLVWSWEEFH